MVTALEIRAEVERLGLEYFGVTRPEVSADFARYQAWLAEGKQAGMHFLERNQQCRRDASLVLPAVQSVIVFGLPYFQGDRWEAGNSAPRIAQYARFKDYHKLLKQKAEAITERLQRNAPQAAFRATVDSAPVLERALGAKTGAAFVGKNTCLIHPEKGSFFLLGEILTSLDLFEPNEATAEGCGTCTRCQVHCPTGALSVDYQIDARQCLSYWTIEHRGTIPERFWPHLREYYFGCDICQLVCPFNSPKKIPRLPREVATRQFPELFEVAVMDERRYQHFFGGTPLTRAKRNGLRRNALIAMTVVDDPKLPEALQIAASDDESPIRETLAQIERWRANPAASRA